MKWFSVKEFKPINSGEFLVYVESTGICYVADVDHFNDGTYHFNHPSGLEYIENISHFMNIPPLPICKEEEG